MCADDPHVTFIIRRKVKDGRIERQRDEVGGRSREFVKKVREGEVAENNVRRRTDREVTLTTWKYRAVKKGGN